MRNITNDKGKRMMNPVVATTVTTAVGEFARLGANIVAYKQATHAIDAKLAEAELNHKLELAHIKAETKHVKKSINKQYKAFKMQFDACNNDINQLLKMQSKLIKEMMKSKQVPSSAHLEMYREMQKTLDNQITLLQQDRQRSYECLSDSLLKTRRSDRSGGFQGVVVDAEFIELP